ncbi:SDR family NAD(P)-dependent oxidoreductase [Gemmatimonas sp. UBA7669]|jgi:short-subunit dehydrogenase|uniref:SDR family NAD(P)-dependent oxidoreductase n=1 Tax=Gemmatimonas sp. UBA7669 TaxID=1946568 RepID=UPI0025BA608A|nr:SDR family oxidoreductase [Gemmatimonas sp. UBA7669]
MPTTQVSPPPSRPVTLITGASDGIGAALAHRLAGRHALVLVARRADKLQAVANAIREAHDTPVVTVVADVTVRSQMDDAVDTALAEFSRLDVLVNNVGRGITRLPSALTDEDLDDMMRVNVKSALYGMQAVLPHFRLVGRGHVVNISSMLGRIPSVVPRAAYSAAKHFLDSLTINFRDEVQAEHPGIQFSLVSPGVVHTEFGNNALHGGVDSRQLPMAQTADEVAAVIAQVIEDRRPDVYSRTGMAARVREYYAGLGQDP